MTANSLHERFVKKVNSFFVFAAGNKIFCCCGGELWVCLLHSFMLYLVGGKRDVNSTALIVVKKKLFYLIR